MSNRFHAWFALSSLASGGAWLAACSSSSDTPSGSDASAETGTDDPPPPQPESDSAISRDASSPPDAKGSAGDIGAECTKDGDCTGDRAKCLTSSGKDFLGAGAPHGYCVTPCAGARDRNCTDVGGSCRTIVATPDGGTASYYCLAGCDVGVDDPNKCHGRSDVYCTAGGAAGPGVCRPACSSDSDCAPLRCDPHTALCSSTVTPGDPFGAHCQEDDAGLSGCAGVCLPLASETGEPAGSICSQPCSFLSTDACGAGDMGTGPKGACLVGQSDHTFGDLGFCVPLCNVAADCLDQVDKPVRCDTNVDIVKAFGRGVCTWGQNAADAGSDAPVPSDAAAIDAAAEHD